jgi:hypothetical protein
VEDSALLIACGCPGGVGDGGGIEEGGRDGDLGTDDGIFEFPEGEVAACEVGALSTASPGGGVENQLTSVSSADLRFLALLVSTPSKRSESEEQRQSTHSKLARHETVDPSLLEDLPSTPARL